MRGWLTFEYPNNLSRLREELVLDYIEEQLVLSLLQNKLFIETVLRSSLSSKSKEVLQPIFDTSKSITQLKLPLAVPKDTIKEDKSDPEALKKELAEWKEIFRKAAESQKPDK